MFIECVAMHSGFLLDFSKITSEDMLEVSIQTFNLEYSLMSKLLLKVLSIDNE